MYVPNQLLFPRLKYNVGVFWAMQKYAGILKFLLWVLIRISHASWRSSNYAGFYHSVNTVKYCSKDKYFLAHTKYYFRKLAMCSQKTKSYLPYHPLANLLLKVLVLISKLQYTTKAHAVVHTCTLSSYGAGTIGSCCESEACTLNSRPSKARRQTPTNHPNKHPKLIK